MLAPLSGYAPTHADLYDPLRPLRLQVAGECVRCVHRADPGRHQGHRLCANFPAYPFALGDVALYTLGHGLS